MANKYLAAILSLIIPGLGQFYSGEGFEKGIIFLIVAIVLYCLTIWWIPYIGIIEIIFAIYAAYDAYEHAK